ncbi:phenylacetate--CoA ligase family protein [Halopiger djelfimassiliensis]|uniref:phenylacetate--CoA ligase family protein n=1 Tax=Halopiger djelfimassiliensis TaxID=1293047 RepID=UPI000677BA75|nr:AMP-binding protein [Halopiger djelfimassiliensis]
MAGMWNPSLETMPRERLERRQRRKFREQAQYVYENVPLFRDKLDRAGIDPEGIETFDDIRAVPTTTKGELRRAQATEDGDTPYGDLLAVDPAEVREYHRTSGTTGTPLRQAESGRDWEWWSDCWATVLWAQGVRPDDRVFVPFSYGAYVAFWAAHYACERIGAEVVPGGNLSSAERVERIADLEATVIVTTPTYALRLAEAAEREGIDPAATSVERIVCAGEPGASVPGTKAALETRWGASVYDHAGATETGAWGYSCDGDSLGLHFNEARFLVEVVDDDGSPVEPGEEGTLVVTPLDRHAQPYLRFEQRDRVTLEAPDVCDCGRTFRIADGGILGRDDEFITVNGVLLSPTAVEDVVRRTDAVTDEYRVVIDDHDEKELDAVTLLAEAAPQNPTDPESIERTLRRRLKRACGLTFRIRLRDAGVLERPERKANRVHDRRSTDG